MTQTNETRHAGARLGSERMRFLAGTAAPKSAPKPEVTQAVVRDVFWLADKLGNFAGAPVGHRTPKMKLPKRVPDVNLPNSIRDYDTSRGEPALSF